jgi:hypothetical protein
VGGGVGGATSDLGGAGGHQAGSGGSGGHGGVGGASSIGTGGSNSVAGAGGSGGHGQAGVGVAGTSGTAGMSGTGGTPCTNSTIDASNCGACGHSCLGATCVAGVCQPLLLGTIPNAAGNPRQTVVSGGKIFVFTSDNGMSADNVWQLDANTPGTSTEVKTNGTVSCIMDGRLFWITSGSANAISSCALSSCTATTIPVVTLGSGTDFGGPPGCDPINDELVWTTTKDHSGYTISRASPTGENSRAITSFSFFNDGANWQFVDMGLSPGETERIFYVRNDDTSMSSSLYYIATNVVNATAVLVANVPNGEIFTNDAQSVVANQAVVLASEYSPTGNKVFSAPLPNGILSGAPPTFTAGEILGGVVDQTTFYGRVYGASIPIDSIVRCPLSDCAIPTVIFRGQSVPDYFADDATAFYWTTVSQTGTQGVAIWKAAK